MLELWGAFVFLFLFSFLIAVCVAPHGPSWMACQKVSGRETQQGYRAALLCGGFHTWPFDGGSFIESAALETSFSLYHNLLEKKTL